LTSGVSFTTEVVVADRVRAMELVRSDATVEVPFPAKRADDAAVAED